MKKAEIEVGKLYRAKVSGTLTTVKILAVATYGNGWVGMNIDTGRAVQIKSAQRLRFEVSA